MASENQRTQVEILQDLHDLGLTYEATNEQDRDRKHKLLKELCTKRNDKQLLYFFPQDKDGITYGTQLKVRMNNNRPCQVIQENYLD